MVGEEAERRGMLSVTGRVGQGPPLWLALGSTNAPETSPRVNVEVLVRAASVLPLHDVERLMRAIRLHIEHDGGRATFIV